LKNYFLFIGSRTSMVLRGTSAGVSVVPKLLSGVERACGL